MLTIDSTLALARLNAMLARLANPEPALGLIGMQQRQAIRQRIQRTKVDPEGDAWAPWQPSTREHRERKGNANQGLLWDEGTLLDSIHMDADMHSVTVGTDVEYAQHLQDGTHRMAARPFVGWTDDDSYHAEMTMLHYIEGVA